MLKINALNAHFAMSAQDVDANMSRFKLRDISLCIKPTQKLAIVGESGSGKSMLAQSLLRLQHNIVYESGSIEYEGENLLTLTSLQMQTIRGKHIAYIPQEPLSALNPLHKVGKQILESIYLHEPNMLKHPKEATSRLESLLESVGLASHLQNAYPFELSGGQRQRVMIAMSIANHPKILICDEPTTALDVLLQRQIMELLNVVGGNSAIIFISHDLGIVRRFCDDVVVMKNGEIVQTSSTKALFANFMPTPLTSSNDKDSKNPINTQNNSPHHPYTQFLLSSLGLFSILIIYLISIPLGITKALRNGSRFDVVSSLVIVIAYALPSFMFGVLLIVLFCGGSYWDIFPLRGLISEDFESLSFLGKIKDYLWHLCLPVLCVSIGGLATLTMLSKNCFLEEIHKSYVLTARAKGANEKRILYGHIFRNAMLLIVSGFPGVFIGAFFSGSLLIEIIFSLDGLGLLGYESVVNRDFPVIFGTLYIFTLLALVIGIVSDLLYCVIDPRIHFGSKYA